MQPENVNKTEQPQPPVEEVKPPINPVGANAIASPLNPEPLEEAGIDEPDSKRTILTTVILFISAILLAFLLTTFVFQQYEVDGPSMETTLHNQDRLIVVKVMKTWSEITGHAWIPNRGDIIIFQQSGLYSATGAPEKQLVKRVIGLPGDRVVINNGVITIYNHANPKGFDPDKTMPYGKVITTTSGNIDLTVPNGFVFVCGDNRPDSLDSRYFGPVDVKNIIGKVDLRIYPFSKVTTY